MDRKTDTLDLENALACPDCDLLLRCIDVARREKALCPRCGKMLYAGKKDSLDKALALSFSGLILYLPANFMSLMTLDTLGLQQSASVYDGIIALYQHHYFFVAAVVALTALFFPLIKLSLLFIVSLSLKLRVNFPGLRLCLRWYHHLDEWCMLEVFMVGILVTVIKMYHMAHIHYDTGFFCFIGLLWVALGSSVVFDKRLFWQLFEHNNM